MNKNIKFIPILTPTYEQWKSLPNYLTHHETSLQRRFGAAKILPPSRWSPLIKNPYELRHIKIYVKQEIIRSTHQSEVFYIQNSETIKRRFMTYDEFKTIAESDTYRLSDSINTPIIDYFWSTISSNQPLYAPNIDESLFSKREQVFNMINLPSLLKYYPKAISGVTTPFLHIGMWSSCVGIHIDEHDLISLNYLHHGSPKIWYIIHPTSYSKFEELVNKFKLFSDITSSCLSPLQHKSLLLKPSFLEMHSIEYYQIEQKINELVIIFPGIYHFYFDTGFNLSETVKYALPSWLQFQRRSPRLCSCPISSSTITINRRFFTTEILNKFQEEYLTSSSTTCIDLSTDDDNNNNNNQTNNTPPIPIETEEITTHIDISLDQYVDPLYSSSSSINSNISTSTDIISSINNSTEQEDIWNIFEQISTQTNSNSIEQNSHPTHYHPYSYPNRCHRQSIYPSYTYSSYSQKRLKRRRCYGCRQQGHLRKECPYFSHE